MTVKHDGWFNALLSDFKYKPGWKFAVEYHAPSLMYMLRVTMMVPSRDDPRCIIPVVQMQHMPPYMAEQGEETFWRFLRGSIHELETHEADEMFLVRGQRVYDPHKGER